MKRVFAVIVICFVIFFSADFVHAQDFAHSYAVVIGIDRYQSQLPLAYAVKDARTMAEYLRSQGYTKVFELYDQAATKNNILAAMQNTLAPILSTDDRVLIFFAGHGFTEVLGGRERGYIVPVEGGRQSAGYVSMDELASQSSYMGQARHQLFIMDSCYGGLLATRASKVDSTKPGYIAEITKRPARQVLTAGGKDQEVQDGGTNGHSFFMDYLMEALQKGNADLNGDGYITFDELAAYMVTRASNEYQTPSVGNLPGHGAGEYYFRAPAGGTTILNSKKLETVPRMSRGETVRSPEPVKTNESVHIPTSQKVVNDPYEYNAYITALNTTNAAAKGAAMEAFAAQYPRSIVKIDALEQAMGAYQQANNEQKVEQIAWQILSIQPNNVRALAIVVFIERRQVKDAASGAKARTDAERGLQELTNWEKPDGVSDADYEKMKRQILEIFAGTAGFGALQEKDYSAAQRYYEQALDVDANDLGNNYQIAIAMLESNPMNPLGLWYGAKALSIAQTTQNRQAVEAWSPYFLSRYKKYHGNTDDWNQRIATAASQSAPPADFVASISLPRTP